MVTSWHIAFLSHGYGFLLTTSWNITVLSHVHVLMLTLHEIFSFIPWPWFLLNTMKYCGFIPWPWVLANHFRNIAFLSHGHVLMLTTAWNIADVFLGAYSILFFANSFLLYQFGKIPMQSELSHKILQIFRILLHPDLQLTSDVRQSSASGYWVKATDRM